MIPKDTEELILNTAHIEDVVGDFVNLKRRGSNMMGVCPFHDEKTPSFVVSPAKGIYKCFGCGKAGNVSKFIMEHESIGYYEALKYLANKYNIEVQEREITPEERQARLLSESLYILNDFAAGYFEKQLFESDEGKSVGLSYFKERGFLESTIKRWNLGYSLAAGNDFITTAKKAQYSGEILGQSGLITKSGNDFFRDRVMFSIHNMSGKIVAFAGRTLSTDKAQPKYINSPETEIYEKRKVLYGLHLAKNAIRKEDECILVEGYTDVITLSQGGIENVVASSGTALTPDQIRLVSRFTPNIKVIYDGDRAGIMAALRGLDLILEQEMNVRLVLLPDGEDPDSYLKKVGTDQFKAFLEDNAKDFIFFKTDLLLQDAANDPVKKSRVTEDIIRSIAGIPNAMLRHNYIKICSSKLDIKEEILLGVLAKEVDKIKANKFKDAQRSRDIKVQDEFESNVIVEEGHRPSEHFEDRSARTIDIYQDESQERDIIRILVTGSDKWFNEENKITIGQYLLHNLLEDIDDFENPLYRRMILIAGDALANGQTLDSSVFTHHSDEDVMITAIDLSTSNYTLANWQEKGIHLQTQPMPDKNFEKDSLSAILRFRLKKIQRNLNNLSIETLELDGNEGKQRENIQIFQQLQKEKSDIMSILKQTIL